MILRRLFVSIWLGVASLAALAQDFTLTILHTNDLHSRVEPVDVRRVSLGGYARQATLIKKFRASDPNVVLLNGGDTFQGTMYFEKYSGLADGFLMDLLGYQGMAAGNHEFDKGTEVLGKFVDNVRFPVLCANVDFSGDPALAGKIKPWTILEVAGQKLGLIGAVTPDLVSISSPGDKIKMLDLDLSLEKAIKELSDQGINKIILLSHLGLGLERRVAQNHPAIDFIVGGHSHTLLGSLEGPAFQNSGGAYPISVPKGLGAQTLIVSAWEWGKVLGRITVDFGPTGDIVRFRNAGPIPVDASVAEDPFVKSAVEAFAGPIRAIGKEVVGAAPEGISRSNHTDGESPMGNVITDGMMAFLGSQVHCALMNAGGIRAAIDAGPVTYEDCYNVQPFNNTLYIVELTGQELLDTLETGVGNSGAFLQCSKELRYEFDRRKPAGQKIIKAEISGKPIDKAALYRICTLNFTALGGDGHNVLKNAARYRRDTGTVDLESLTAYIKKNSPLVVKLDGRIVDRTGRG